MPKRTKGTIKCPKCGNSQTYVQDTRYSKDGMDVIRRRLCKKCYSLFWTQATQEMVIDEELYEIKYPNNWDGGNREDYLNKLISVTRRKKNGTAE